MTSTPPSKAINPIDPTAPHFLTQLLTALSTLPHPVPSAQTLTTARTMLTRHLPQTGLGLEPMAQQLLSLLPSFARTTAHYYAFVTGSATPAAYLADLLVSTVDSNVQVHLPQDSLVTEVEDVALRLLCQLFQLDEGEWAGRVITTGATAGNILGLACGREEVLNRRLHMRGVSGGGGEGVGELGLLEACVRAEVTGVKVFSAMAHSSLLKAAAVVGIGRRNVVDIGRVEKPWEIDLARLRNELEKAGVAGVVCIIAVSIGEVNTGRFDEGMEEIRKLADEHDAWLHADAAFGIFARVLESESGNGGLARGLELADSIVGDGHKILNVPYDCGFFFTRDPGVLSATFANVAPYLSSSSSSSPDGIQSPLNIGLENSRRFRALPVYATLCAYGVSGYRDLLHRLVTHSRNIAAFIHGHGSYQLLNGPVEDIFIIVLFSAKEDELNNRLKIAINDTREMYVSGTVWNKRPAIRIAVANWQVESDEWEVVKEVLSDLARPWLTDLS